MSIDAAGTGRPGRKQESSSTVVWAVTGVLCLITVLFVWLAKADSQPSNVFGSAGANTLLVVSLIAIVVATATRGAGLTFRRIFGLITIVLALGVEVLALAQLSAGRGAADTAFGVVLTVGVIAMLGASIGLIRGRKSS